MKSEKVKNLMAPSFFKYVFSSSGWLYLGDEDVYGTPGIVEAGRHKDDAAGPGDTGQAAREGGRQFGSFPFVQICPVVVLLVSYSNLFARL